MDFATFLNTQDAHPMRNELRRAIATVEPEDIDVIQDHFEPLWHQMEDVRAQRFKLKPHDGPYTLALVAMSIAASNTRGWIEKDDIHADVQGLVELECYAQNHYEEAARKDAALLDFWLRGAYSYESICPNCEPVVMKLFAERVVKYAHQMAYKEPDRAMADIFYRAANHAADDFSKEFRGTARTDDMEFVKQSTAAQVQLFESMPGDPVEYFAEPPEYDDCR